MTLTKPPELWNPAVHVMLVPVSATTHTLRYETSWIYSVAQLYVLTCKRGVLTVEKSNPTNTHFKCRHTKKKKNLSHRFQLRFHLKCGKLLQTLLLFPRKIQWNFNHRCRGKRRGCSKETEQKNEERVQQSGRICHTSLYCSFMGN